MKNDKLTISGWKSFTYATATPEELRAHENALAEERYERAKKETSSRKEGN